ncbi:MAG: phytanoyl-CoA dioxygenase family protein [Planctomycetaceae bacterium]|jgi:hypothetical protein|nr:phytanoyl-CoA dioxygenase family protein [Phycisphaerales bacterium]MCE2654203.1 phytanoyl-CoA dioxygenase family protein [Planctomycetaceae bacterium]
MSPTAQAFATSGCAVIDRLLDPQTVAALRDACEPLLADGPGSQPGVRRVLDRNPVLADIIRSSPIPTLARTVVGSGVRVVRSILFDKTASTNWLVPWHQDAAIAVRHRVEADGFGPWSIKQGEPHCRPPREILDSIVVIRVHLDAVDGSNGPLRIVPNSHRQGLLESSEISRLVSAVGFVECHTDAGGIVLLHPHSVHSSPRATHPARRRVLHLECTRAELPDGLQWAEGFPLDGP